MVKTDGKLPCNLCMYIENQYIKQSESENK